MAFEKKVWADGQGGGTPITAEELNRIETGIDDAHTGVPAEGTAQLLETGVNTSQRTWTAKAIHDEIARQIAAIPPAG
ncbi:hypothetical protein [Rhodococcus koreensis]|uniref:hypothetical protein n=1 Tax=Rhodococcus koreensis TaxID=99653 RepID=UPI0036DE45CC